MLNSRKNLLFIILCIFQLNVAANEDVTPLVIGETFIVESKVLKESRRINVFLPAEYKKAKDISFPVLYMPDGGLAEDFMHVAGLLQVSIINQTMRPFILVGIENTERRRDLTGPTVNEEDKKVAPRVGGSNKFRQFIKNELMPKVKLLYRTTNETAIIGESYAGLFVLETFFLETELFDTYIAIDPSVWWNNGDIVRNRKEYFEKLPNLNKTLFFASSDLEWTIEPSEIMAKAFEELAPTNIKWHYQPMPNETHATIYHPTALKAFRKLFKPQVKKQK